MPDDFFTQQQKMATRAMVKCCSETWQVIEQDTNIKPLIRKRPLASVAIAVAGGLAAGYLLTPSRGGRRARHQHINGHTAEHRGLMAMLERQLASALLPLLKTAVASAVGLAFANIQEGHTDGKPPDDQEPLAPPQPRMQL